MREWVGGSRSLTNPFNPDPVLRTGTNCNVAKKRTVSSGVKKLTKSLSKPMLQAPPARSDASTKRALSSKAQRLKQMEFIKKYSTSAAQKGRANLAYFHYCQTVPPTPITTNDGDQLFEVDRVLGKIVCECGRTTYLVKWSGYPNSENSCIAELPEEFQSEWV
jgi:hypothetical protein